MSTINSFVLNPLKIINKKRLIDYIICVNGGIGKANTTDKTDENRLIQVINFIAFYRVRSCPGDSKLTIKTSNETPTIEYTSFLDTLALLEKIFKYRHGKRKKDCNKFDYNKKFINFVYKVVHAEYVQMFLIAGIYDICIKQCQCGAFFSIPRGKKDIDLLGMLKESIQGCYICERDNLDFITSVLQEYKIASYSEQELYYDNANENMENNTKDIKDKCSNSYKIHELVDEICYNIRYFAYGCDRDALLLVLITGRETEDNLLHKDYLPMDMFKIILANGGLL